MVDVDKIRRKNTCLKEINFVIERERFVGRIVDKIDQGLIPLRLRHSDTKLNIILLDNKTFKSLCVIDLDTIMSGSLLYDLGDSIRFGCNPAGEDEKDLSKVLFNKEYFRAYVEGYLSQVGNIITKEELEELSFAGILMIFECGMRFLSDYLDGDQYFKTKYPEHNLVRARTQFKLVKEMEEIFTELKEIVNQEYIRSQMGH